MNPRCAHCRAELRLETVDRTDSGNAVYVSLDGSAQCADCSDLYCAGCMSGDVCRYCAQAHRSERAVA